MKRSLTLAVLMALSHALFTREAAAQEPPPAPPPPNTSDVPKEKQEPKTEPQSVTSPERKVSAEPTAALAPPVKPTFDADPIVDGAIVGVAMGFAGILDLINGTGEIRPQQVPQNFDRSKLL